MKKKQLILQNSSLFAEIERKAGEIEALHIKIEDLNETIKHLNSQNQALNKHIVEISNENENLKAEKEQLLSDLKKASIDELAEQPQESDSEVFEPTAEEIAKQPTEEPLPTVSVQAPPDFNNVVVVPDKEESSFEGVEATIPENKAVLHTNTIPKANPHADILRAYGAEHIGKITRLTAKILALVNNDEGTKNIVLGKNESFKFEILSLINQNGSVDEIKSKMDDLANQTEEYLKTIQNI